MTYGWYWPGGARGALGAEASMPSMRVRWLSRDAATRTAARVDPNGSLLPRALQRLIKSICSSYFDVGLDSGALPVRLGDRVHEAAKRHSNEEMTVDPVGCHGMGTTTRRLTDQSRSPEALQVETHPSRILRAYGLGLRLHAVSSRSSRQSMKARSAG